jgi:hypothetical protein
MGANITEEQKEKRRLSWKKYRNKKKNEVAETTDLEMSL